MLVWWMITFGMAFTDPAQRAGLPSGRIDLKCSADARKLEFHLNASGQGINLNRAIGSVGGGDAQGLQKKLLELAANGVTEHDSAPVLAAACAHPHHTTMPSARLTGQWRGSIGADPGVVDGD
jgi:hypothetical protein